MLVKQLTCLSKMGRSNECCYVISYKRSIENPRNILIKTHIKSLESVVKYNDTKQDYFEQ